MVIMIDMKTRFPTSSQKQSRGRMKTKIILALSVVITAVLTSRPLNAQSPVIHAIDFTETSSTSLTATYDNSTARVSVSPVGQDEWNVSVGSITLNFAEGSSWAEPTGNLFNSIVGISFEGSNENPTVVLDIRSDTSIASLITLPNGATVTAGTDNLDGATIKMTFTDRGDVASAPEAGSTFALLALALAALVGVSRLRSTRLA